MKTTLTIITLALLCGCATPGPTPEQKYPADPGHNLIVTNIVGGVTNIAPLHLGNCPP